MATSLRKGRIGQAEYWIWFGLYVVAVLGLVGFSLYSFATGEFGRAVTAILPLAPLGIYFRVIEMRRCRDIGWPAILPWLFFVIPMGVGFTIRASGMGTDIATAIAALTVPLLISLVDFIFSIVIGCIATKAPGEDYARIFGGDPQPARSHSRQDPHPSGEPGHDRFDEAIARALEARRTAGAEPARAFAAEPPAIASTAHARSVVGFGRKVV
jgi:uncharacterized membrane protein YhaH (DUF805 family)